MHWPSGLAWHRSATVDTEVCVDTDLWKTRSMNKLFQAVFIAAIVLLAGGCASRPELIARSAAVPPGVDLSGRWEMQGYAEEPDARQVEREQGIYLPPASTAGRRQQGPPRAGGIMRTKSPSVYVFIENGRSLKITQTGHGLFVSFDRSVVEEYTFGENRIVALGPIEAQRVSGWEGSMYIVETMDERGATLTETWALAGEGSLLVREVNIVDGNKQLYSSRQVFDRT